MCHGHSSCVCHLSHHTSHSVHHHDVHHHSAHHDVHHHDSHIVADHREINRLQGETDKLIVDRKVLKTQNTQTLEEVEQLKVVEGDLRNNVDELLKEMEDKERIATATKDELKQSIQALTILLATREEELTNEVEKSTLLSEKNEELTATNEDLKQTEEKLTGDLSAAKENLAATLVKNELEIKDLNCKITALCEAGRCAPHHPSPVVVRVDKNFHSHGSFSHC